MGDYFWRSVTTIWRQADTSKNIRDVSKPETTLLLLLLHRHVVRGAPSSSTRLLRVWMFRVTLRSELWPPPGRRQRVNNRRYSVIKIDWFIHDRYSWVEGEIKTDRYRYLDACMDAQRLCGIKCIAYPASSSPDVTQGQIREIINAARPSNKSPQANHTTIKPLYCFFCFSLHYKSKAARG